MVLKSPSNFDTLGCEVLAPHINSPKGQSKFFSCQCVSPSSMPLISLALRSQVGAVKPQRSVAVQWAPELKVPNKELGGMTRT